MRDGAPAMNLREFADKIGAVLSGPGDMDITGAAGILEAGQGQVTFAADTAHIKELEHSHASAAIVPQDAPDMRLPLLRAKNPRLAFAKALEILYCKILPPIGISEKAVIGAGTIIGKGPSIHPNVVVAENARIGDRVTLYPGVYIGRESVIGDDTVVHPNVSIGDRIVIGRRVILHSGTVVGSDGFGFVTDGGKHHKIPQTGGVIIEDDVEIGGNCSIDRATLGNTLIKQGTKIDNLVHVAHNVTIGEHCLIAGQAGIAGSSTIGNYVVFAGQVGVGDHRKIGDRVMAGGKAVITKDIEAGQVVAGNYAMPVKEWLKVQAVLPKLPELKRLVADLVRRITDIEKKN